MKKIIFLGILIISQLAYASREPLPNFEFSSVGELLRVRPAEDDSNQLVIDLLSHFNENSLARRLRSIGFPIGQYETITIRIPTTKLRYRGDYLFYFNSDRLLPHEKTQVALMFRSAEKRENYVLREEIADFYLWTSEVTITDARYDGLVKSQLRVFFQIRFEGEENIGVNVEERF